MFVVDCSDRVRFPEVKDEVWRLLGEEELRNTIFLVMANKQDLPNAMSVEELTEQLEMSKARQKEWCKLPSYPQS